MATKPSFVATFFVTLMLIMASSTITARPLMKPTVDDSPSPSPSPVDSPSQSPSPVDSLSPSPSPFYHLSLEAEDEGYCWDSLMQLQHCSGELIMFFLNGETYVGPGCCNAIRTVGKKCWPTMIGVLGFTAQEGDMLQGYCENHDDPNP